MDRPWLVRFLTLSGYANRDSIICELFPEKTFAYELLSPHNNLPSSNGSFEGREVDLARVEEGLTSKWPVISIEGMGGVGKTRLAIEAAHHSLLVGRTNAHPMLSAAVWVSAKDHPNRKSWFNTVLDTIASVLDYPYVTELPIEKKASEVNKLVAMNPILLIIDNFETIEDTELLQFIQRIPEPSKVLVTTRKGQIQSAWFVHLKGLTEPYTLTLIRMHCRRLGMFSLEKEDDRALVSLARVTDGNPKAIETALGCIKRGVLSLNEVVDNLSNGNQSFGSLFKDLFASAWDLLSADTQKALILMPFFAASSSRDAIGASADLTEYKLNSAIEQLVEMSLIDIDTESQTSPHRYSLHPLVRAFLENKLVLSPQIEQDLRQRWVEYYVEYAQNYGDDDLGGEIGDGKPGHREKLREEIQNLRCVIDWSFDHAEGNAVRVVERITTFLLDEGFWSERLGLCKRALAAAQRCHMRESEIGLLARLGWSYLVLGDLENAEAAMLQGQKLAEDYQLENRLAQVIRDYGRLQSIRGDYQKASELFQASYNVANRIGDNLATLLARTFQAEADVAYGRTAQAELALRELLPEFISNNHPREVDIMYRCLGEIATRDGRFDEARSAIQKAISWSRTHYEAHEVSQGYQALGNLEAAIGNWPAAGAAYEQALDVATRLGMQPQTEQLSARLESISGQMHSIPYG